MVWRAVHHRTCTVTDKVLGYNMVQEMMAHLLRKR